jgi:DNA-binding CsgD family transcriptional regulator
VLATLDAGRGATVLIEGVPGIGKTALLRCGRQRATGAGVRVLGASGSELDRHLAFGGLRQLFFDVLRSGAELTGPAAAAAPALGLGDAAEPPDAAAVAHALRWVLSGLAARQPILLVVDDLQWVDPGSRQVLAHLCSRTQDRAIGFLFATRPDDATVDFEHTLRDAESRELHPAPLSAVAVARLVGGAIAGRADAAFLAACMEVTGGVPFLVTELLREIRARGLDADADGAAVVRGLAPRAVQRHVLARLERVSDDARRFARAASILPPGADATLAAAIAGIDDDGCAPVVRSLVEAYVLRDRPLDFCHPVMRAAVLETLSSVEVSETHRRAAAALRRRSAPAAAIALHLLHAQPRGVAADAEVLAAAGSEAAAAGAPQTAVEYLRRALAEPPPLAARPEVTAALGRALAATGDDAAVSLLHAAYEAEPDPGARAQVALHLAEALAGDEDSPDDAVRVLQRAAQDLPVGDDRRLALLARLAVFANRGSLADVQAWCLSEIPADLAGDTPAQRACMVIQAYSDRRVDPRRLLLAVAQRPDFVSGDLPGSVIVGWAIMGLRAIGELQLACDLAQQGAQHAEGWGRPGAVARRLAQLALMQWRLGRIADALATLERAMCFLDGTTADGDRTWIESAAARVAIVAGQLDSAAAAVQLLPATGASAPWVWLAKAELAAARGDFARAADLFPRPEPNRLTLDPVQVDPVPRGALWLAAAGRTREARQVLEYVECHVEHFQSAATRGVLLAARGVVERDADVTRSGVDLLAATEFRFAHAETLVDLGMLLRRSGAAKDARAALRAGLDEARAMGAAMLAQTAAAELAVAGARKVARAARGTSALTGSELRVAQRAAAGATNAQIAEALFINVKTVEMHLANTYRKLGIANRARLAEALRAVEVAADEREPVGEVSGLGSAL